jgi:hypothetical protein
MSTETNDKPKASKVWSVTKRAAAMLTTAAAKAAGHFREADGATMAAARIIADVFDRVDGLTYDRWSVYFADADRDVLTPSRVSQFRTAAVVERAAGVPLTSERQARDLAASLKDDGVDLHDGDAVRRAIAADGGVSARVMKYRKGKTSAPRASKDAPSKPTPATVADPVVAVDDAVAMIVAACRGNRETLALVADNLARHAEAVRRMAKPGPVATAPAPIGKATRKVPA